MADSTVMSGSLSMDPEETIVQTKLDSEEYDRLKRVADDEGFSLEEALKRAPWRTPRGMEATIRRTRSSRVGRSQVTARTKTRA